MRYVPAVALLFLAACASTPTPKPKGVQVQEDPFLHQTSFSAAPQTSHPRGNFAMGSELVSIWDRKTQTMSQQIVIHLAYVGHRDPYKEAYDDTVTRLPVESIRHHPIRCMTNACDITEDLVVKIDDATLRSRIENGYHLRLYSRDGVVIDFNYKPETIRAQYDAIDRYFLTQ